MKQLLTVRLPVLMRPMTCSIKLTWAEQWITTSFIAGVGGACKGWGRERTRCWRGRLRNQKLNCAIRQGKAPPKTLRALSYNWHLTNMLGTYDVTGTLPGARGTMMNTKLPHIQTTNRQYKIQNNWEGWKEQETMASKKGYEGTPCWNWSVS